VPRRPARLSAAAESRSCVGADGVPSVHHTTTMSRFCIRMHLCLSAWPGQYYVPLGQLAGCWAHPLDTGRIRGVELPKTPVRRRCAVGCDPEFSPKASINESASGARHGWVQGSCAASASAWRCRCSYLRGCRCVGSCGISHLDRTCWAGGHRFRETSRSGGVGKLEWRRYDLRTRHGLLVAWCDGREPGCGGCPAGWPGAVGSVAGTVFCKRQRRGWCGGLSVAAL